MAQPRAAEWETHVLAAFEAENREGRVPSEAALERALYWLRQGVPVVIPTETVYGLAAPALDRAAVEAIFVIKGRPLDNPLIVHVAGAGQLPQIGAHLSDLAARLADAFWPGPLTLVLRADAALPWVTAGLDSIAVRQPQHDFAAELIRRAGPLAAPSANLSGLPSPTRASHAVRDLVGRVPLVIDGGDLDHGVESTVIDARGDVPLLLRPGALSLEAIEACAGRAVGTPESGGHARSPGMKYRHYSPRAELWLYPLATPGAVSVQQQLGRDARQLRAQGRRVAVIARQPLDADHFIALPAEPAEFARQLFGWLRELDDLKMDNVLVEGVRRVGVGRAIMDRLERAASQVRAPDVDAPEGESP